jgi:predicted flavoprotein YhiN
MIEPICSLDFKVLDVDKKGETVRAGGVPLDELTPNLESKFHKNLYFTGEILNVDGACGGFNLQFAWSSASIVALDIVKNLAI